MIWKYLSSSVTGRSHLLRNEGGQDYCRAGTIQKSAGQIFIGLAADGAGSSSDGETGARIACDTVYACIVSTIGNDSDLAGVSAETIAGWIVQARESIRIESERQGKELRDYACTLMGAIVGDHSVFFQIGDGAIVVARNDDAYETVFWPQQGEYANTTFFLSDDTFRDSLMVAQRDTAPRQLALLTDGLQNLALSYPERSVHSGFFKPLFEFLQSNSGNEYLSSHLRDFLDRDEVNERNDDDKTLILAVQGTA